MSNDTRNPKSDTGDDFDLDAFFEDFDYGNTKKHTGTQASGVGRASNPREQSHASSYPREQANKTPLPQRTDALGATMSYDAVGEQAPELPFADEAKGTSGPSQSRLASYKSQLTRLTSRASSAQAARRADTGSSSQAPTTSTRPSAIQASQAPSKEPPASYINRASRSTRPSGSKAFPNQYEQQGAYVPINENSSTYRIRGGGNIRMRSPLLLTIYGIIFLIAVLLVFLAVTKVNDYLSSRDTVETITLTQTQTRAAIDKNLPMLTSLIGIDFDEISSAFTSQGVTVFTDSRFATDVTTTTVKLGIIGMPQAVSSDFMDGYFTDRYYNAYTVQELQDYFNGAWVLELARTLDEENAFDQFKVTYVNLNGIGVDEEMDYLAELQGLTGENVTVATRGADGLGNTIIQGTKVVEETVYYFKIAACPFNGVYTANPIPENAIYISCTVATFDFYTTGE